MGALQNAAYLQHCGMQSTPANMPACLPPSRSNTQPPANVSGEAHEELAIDTKLNLADCMDKVWQLVTNKKDCRKLQDFIQEATEDSHVVLLVGELHGKVVEAMRCEHANHVLQKFIQRVPSNSLQFVIDELKVHGFVAAAKHKFGCRVVQRLLENCSSAQLAELLDTLLTDPLALSKHASAHFVMVCLLATAQSHSCTHSIALTKALTELVSSLGRDDKVHGSHAQGESLAFVLKTALEEKADESQAMIDARMALARALMSRDDVLLDLVSANNKGFRHGPETVKLAVEVVGAKQEEIEDLKATTTETTRYGRELKKKLCSLIVQETAEDATR